MIPENINITKIHSVLFFTGKPLSAANDYSGRLSHNELIYKVSGELEAVFGNQVLSAGTHSVRFLPKTDKFVKYIINRKTVGDSIDIFFDTEKPVDINAFSVQPHNHDKIAKLFYKAESTWRKRKKGYEYTVKGILYEILGELLKDASYINSEKSEKIRNGVKYIENNFTKNFNIEILGDMCGISYAYFKKIFISKYNMPPKSYIISMRIRYACDLLKSNIYSISQIAEMTGYENVYYFSKSFKRVMNVTPTEYKAGAT